MIIMLITAVPFKHVVKMMVVVAVVLRKKAELVLVTEVLSSIFL